MKFIDCLKQAIKRQIIGEKTKDELVKKLGVSNANPKCKKVLRTLPPGPDPTLIQMIEACDCLGMPDHLTTLQAQACATQGETEALSAIQTVPRDRNNKVWAHATNVGNKDPLEKTAPSEE